MAERLGNGLLNPPRLRPARLLDDRCREVVVALARRAATAHPLRSVHRTVWPAPWTRPSSRPRPPRAPGHTGRVQRLDTALPPLIGARRLALLKVDAEGHDLAVLRGAAGAMRRF